MAGATPAEIEEWRAFLGNAIGGLREAAIVLRIKKEEFEAKKDWFRKKKTGIPKENSVSQALALLFEFIRANQAISGSGVQNIDLRHISISCEKPRPLDPGISDESNPTDYALVLLKDMELDLRIEAKTILSESEIRDKYVGHEGLLRFDDDSNPYTIARFGGMVAYVVDADAPTWAGRIATAVAAKVGAERSGSMTIGPHDHQVSYHHVSVNTPQGPAEYDIDVIHFALEIDASPPQR
jgi:hypothetical protein